jgi:hypothetical protein
MMQDGSLQNLSTAMGVNSVTGVIVPPPPFPLLPVNAFSVSVHKQVFCGLSLCGVKIYDSCFEMRSTSGLPNHQISKLKTV